MTSWSNKDTFQFIELYKKEEVIWNPGHKHHKDRFKVKEAWSRIESVMKKPVSDLKKRKEILMTTFRLRFKQKQLAIKLGRANEFSTTWVFFNALEDFLKDIYELKNVNDKTENTINYEQKNYEEESVEEEVEKERFNVTEKEIIKPNSLIPLKRERPSHNSLELEEYSDKSDDENDCSYKQGIKQEPNTSKSQDSEDDCALYGRILARKLRRFSQNEREELMYEIDGLLLKRNRNRHSPDSSQQITVDKLPKFEEFGFRMSSSPS